MRPALTAALILAATSAFSQDTTSGSAAPAGIPVTTSYNMSAPMAGKTAEEEAAEDQTYRTQMYALAAGECADLLASIATSCSVTNISVSTQITRQPGIANQMYASGTVNMLVELK